MANEVISIGFDILSYIPFAALLFFLIITSFVIKHTSMGKIYFNEIIIKKAKSAEENMRTEKEIKEMQGTNRKFDEIVEDQSVMRYNEVIDLLTRIIVLAVKQISNVYNGIKKFATNFNVFKQSKTEIFIEKHDETIEEQWHSFDSNENNSISGIVKKANKTVKHYKLKLSDSEMVQTETTKSLKTLNVTKRMKHNPKTKDSFSKDGYGIHSKKTNLNKKIQHLSWSLQDLKSFEKPNIKLEQYATSAEIAAVALHIAQMNYCDISGKVIADLGCGCGVLTIGAHLLDAELCIGIDICERALRVCQKNISNFNCCNVELVQTDVISLNDRWYKKFDTVIMNPPFGTKGNKGIDIKFLKQAISLAKTAVYSFHKTATRKYIQDVSEKWNVKMEPLYQIRFNLPKTYEKHIHTVKDIEVDLLRFSFLNKDSNTK